MKSNNCSTPPPRWSRHKGPVVERIRLLAKLELEGAGGWVTLMTDGRRRRRQRDGRHHLHASKSFKTRAELVCAFTVIQMAGGDIQLLLKAMHGLGPPPPAPVVPSTSTPPIPSPRIETCFAFWLHTSSTPASVRHGGMCRCSH